MTLVKVVLKYGFGQKSTYLDYKHSSNFEDFKKQFTSAFPILERKNSYKMYWVDDSYGGSFIVKTGHYFHLYVANGASRRLLSGVGDTCAHYLLIELEDNNVPELESSAPMPSSSSAKLETECQTTYSVGTPLTVAINTNVPVNFKRLLAILNCTTDDKWLDIAKSTAYVLDSNRIQHGVRCNGCESEITGARYKCVQCKNYNLCTVCSVFRQMHTEHIMLKLCETSTTINSLLIKNIELSKANGSSNIEQLLGVTSSGDTDILSSFSERLAILLKPIPNGGVSQRLACVSSAEPLPGTSNDATATKSFDDRIDSKFLERIRSSIEHVTIKEPESIDESDESSESEDWTFVTHSGDVKRTLPSNSAKTIESNINFQSEDYSRMARNVQKRLAGRTTAATSIPSNLGKKIYRIK